MLAIAGKIFDYTFPEVLSVWDTSYPKILKVHQFENVCLQPRNLVSAVTTFIMLTILKRYLIIPFQKFFYYGILHIPK